jgi:hypothetical protein
VITSWDNRRVVPDNFHDFFLTSGSVAGALIGLLFVVISVSAERLSHEKSGAQLNRIRAAAALTAFINALTVSLFALLPGAKLGGTALVVAVLGFAFVVASLLSLYRLREVHWATVRDAVFLIGLLVVFVDQAIAGTSVLTSRGTNPGSVDTIAILVIVCFLIGIGRAWDLIGGPSIGITREVAELVRSREPERDGETG